MSLSTAASTGSLEAWSMKIYALSSNFHMGGTMHGGLGAGRTIDRIVLMVTTGSGDLVTLSIHCTMGNLEGPGRHSFGGLK